MLLLGSEPPLRSHPPPRGSPLAGQSDEPLQVSGRPWDAHALVPISQRGVAMGSLWGLDAFEAWAGHIRHLLMRGSRPHALPPLPRSHLESAYL